MPTRSVAAEPALREYGIGAQVLADLGIHDIILLSHGQRGPVAIEGYGLTIVEQRSF